MENTYFKDTSYVNFWINQVNKWYKQYELFITDNEETSSEDSYNLISISQKYSQIEKKSTFSSPNAENYNKYSCLNSSDKSIVIKEENKFDPDIMITEEHLYFKKQPANNNEKSNEHHIYSNSSLTSTEIFITQAERTNVPIKYIFMCLLCGKQNDFYLAEQSEIETFCLKCFAKHKLMFHEQKISATKLKMYKTKNNHSHESCHQFSDKQNKAKSIGKPNSSSNEKNDKFLENNISGNALQNTSEKNKEDERYTLKKTLEESSLNTSLRPYYINSRRQQQHGNEIFNNNPSEKSKLKCLETNLLKNCNKKYGTISSSLNNPEEKYNGNDNNMKKHMKRKYSSKLESDIILVPNIFAFNMKKIKDDFYTKNFSSSDTINSHNSVKSVKKSSENLNKLTLTNSNERFNNSDKSYQSYSDQTEQLQEINSSENNCKTNLLKTDKNCDGIKLTYNIKNVEIKLVPLKEYEGNTNNQLNLTKYDENNKQTKDLESSSSSSDEEFNLNLKLFFSETRESDVLPFKNRNSLKQDSYKKKLRSYKKI